MAGQTFAQGQKYTRAQVAAEIGLPPVRQGGNWNTGYDSWNGELIVFCNVGTAGRTGHDYKNRWEGAELEWFAKNGTHLRQPLIQRMVSGALPVHVFWRSKDNHPFTYAGKAEAVETRDTSPVSVRWRFPALD